MVWNRLTLRPQEQYRMAGGAKPMETNYEKMIRENLRDILAAEAVGLEDRLPASREGQAFRFKAFGEDCCLGPAGVTFSGEPDSGPKALLITLYAKQVTRDPIQLEPFRAFKDLPNSTPYHGAFKVNTERVLIPFVPLIRKSLERIAEGFCGEKNPTGISADFSLLLYPLPKIALCYVFYLGDEDFPHSATCLFSANALSFAPLDGLADVAEYTSREIIRILI